MRRVEWTTEECGEMNENGLWLEQDTQVTTFTAMEA